MDYKVVVTRDAEEDLESFILKGDKTPTSIGGE